MTKVNGKLKKRHAKLMKERRALYNTYKKCHCPLLGADIIFNARGFHHLKWDGLGHPRSLKEQMYRAGLIPLIIPVIGNATKVHDYRKYYSESAERYVEDWTLKEVVGKSKSTITVILRKAGNGQISFYSVWKKYERKKISKKPSSK